MGFDCGFDIFPCLSVNAKDKEAYQLFLDEVVSTYGDAYDDSGRREDGKVLDVSLVGDDNPVAEIRFMVGECRSIPHDSNDCNYLLRFSSKVSGPLSAPAEPYIKGVYEIAKKHFGSKVHFWHEQRETDDERQWDYYSWQAVHNAEQSMEESRRQRTQSAQDQASN